MSRNALELVFPIVIGLLVCTMVVLFLTATGLAPNTSLALAAEQEPSDYGMVDKVPADSTLDSAVSQAALSPEDAKLKEAGNALFKGNCAQCHAVNDVVVGPALAGINERRPQPWLIKWIKNSSKMVASGDEYAVKLFNEYQKQQMPSFALTDKEVAAILRYIESEEGRAVAVSSEVVACLY